MKPDKYEFFDKVRDYFYLKIEDACGYGLLAARPEGKPCSYSLPVLEFHARINESVNMLYPKNLYCLHASLVSIDDSGWTFFFNSVDSKEKCTERLTKLVEFLNGFNGFVPTFEETQEFIRTIGGYVDSW